MPSTVTPTARSASRSTIATTVGERLEPVESIGRSAQTSASSCTTSRQRRTSPATSASSSRAIVSASARARLIRRPAAPRALAREAREDLSLGLGPDPFDVAQAARFRRGAQLVRGADAELAAERDHPLRPEADEPAERDELRLDLALELFELGEATGLDELDEPAARSPGRSRAVSRTRPARTSSATGARVSRISSAARRYARTV